MSRSPQEELERLERDVSLQWFVEACGAKAKADGSESSPCRRTHPEESLWHSLTACGHAGSASDWLRAAEGKSFRHSAELLLAGG